MREFKNFFSFCFLAPQKQACDACLAELVKKEFYAEFILGIGKKIVTRERPKIRALGAWDQVSEQYVMYCLFNRKIIMMVKGKQTRYNSNWNFHNIIFAHLPGTCASTSHVILLNCNHSNPVRQILFASWVQDVQGSRGTCSR